VRGGHIRARGISSASFYPAQGKSGIEGHVEKRKDWTGRGEQNGGLAQRKIIALDEGGGGEDENNLIVNTGRGLTRFRDAGKLQTSMESSPGHVLKRRRNWGRSNDSTAGVPAGKKRVAMDMSEPGNKHDQIVGLDPPGRADRAAWGG